MRSHHIWALAIGVVSFFFSNRPFSYDWWLTLFFTGISIGLVSSVKWTGFFVTALVGLNSIYELWTFYGDYRISKVICFTFPVISLALFFTFLRVHFAWSLYLLPYIWHRFMRIFLYCLAPDPEILKWALGFRHTWKAMTFRKAQLTSLLEAK